MTWWFCWEPNHKTFTAVRLLTVSKCIQCVTWSKLKGEAVLTASLDKLHDRRATTHGLSAT
jgi:hypothetical protein